ncbi:MAG: nitronate monooxygenase [Pseudomonas sp.]|uniref:NAD(P)H-dependent flavin oxidoreductase n=1 Tax=Pseudomonas sp. TaxID=306 RepID=UPI003394AC3A
MQTATALLGIQHPIIQAPMVGVSSPQLVAAVSNAGALGSLAVGASTVEQARALIVQTRALTARPFHVNLFCHRPAVADAQIEAAWLEHLRPYFAEFGAEPPRALNEIYRSFLGNEAMLEMLLAECPAVVSFHFGLPPRDWIQALQQAGIVVLASATSPVEAALGEEAGVDMLVAQGIEAGGHRGTFDPEEGDSGLGTLALVRLLAKQSTLPIVAAGGIMDGQGIAAVRALGASIAQLGTAFLLCPEAATPAAYRNVVRNVGDRRTGITAAISGRAARGLVNRMHLGVDVTSAPSIPAYPIAYDAGKALHAAASARGSQDFAAHWAGQGVALARELPAAELIHRLLEELHSAS